MILFVFEGKDDKTYFESIKRLFLSKKSDTFVCTYNISILSLYILVINSPIMSRQKNVKLQFLMNSPFPLRQLWKKDN